MAYTSGNTKYARNDQLRAHLFMDGVGTYNPDPLYFPCLGIEAMTRDKGEITPVEVPDPDRYGEYITVDGIPGQQSRWTTSMTTRMILGEESPLRALERRENCGIDVHLTRGVCDVPTDYNTFAELEIWEDVLITSYSTSALSAISSDARESTTETVDVSIGNVYKIYNMVYGLIAAPAEASGVPQGIAIAPSWCCGSGECAITFSASKGKLYFTSKAGTVQTGYAGNDIAGIATIGNRLAVARDAIGLDLITYTRNGFVTTSTRVVSGVTTIDAISTNGRKGIFSSALKLYTFDATGSNITSADVTSLAGGTATKLSAVSVAEDGTFVAVSDKGLAMYSTNGTEWKAAIVLPGTTPVGTAVAALSMETWLVGNTAGEIWMTSDSGASWHSTIDVIGNVNAIVPVTRHVAYAAIGAALYRSTDGGASWTLEPSVLGRTFPAVTSLDFIAACADNPNNLAMVAVSATTMRVITGRPG